MGSKRNGAGRGGRDSGAAVGVDGWREAPLLQPMRETPPDDVWDQAEMFSERFAADSELDATGTFAPLPSELAREKSYAIFGRQLEEHLYREATLDLLRCDSLDCSSHPGDSKRDFLKRLEPLAGEKREAERARLERKPPDPESRIKKAEAHLSTQKWQFWSRITGVLWVLVETALRLMGQGRAGRPRSPEVAMRGVATERGQQVSAQASLAKLLSEKQSLQAERDQALADVDGKFQPDQLPLEPLVLKPRKADVEIDRVSLVWLPFRVNAAGRAEAIYQTPASTSESREDTGDEAVG